MRRNFYSEVFQALYSSEVEEIKKSLEKSNFALVYVDKKDHPAEFFDFISTLLRVSNARNLATSNSILILPFELQAEDTSSAEFLSKKGLEAWWVSDASPSRVHEVLHKLVKGKWARSILILTDDEPLFLSLGKIGKTPPLVLPPLKNERLVEFAEHYAVHIGCEETRCLAALKDVRMEAHITDVEQLVEYVQHAMELCHLHRRCQPLQCSGISTDLAESLLVHFSQNRASMLVSLRKGLLDFVRSLYEKRVNFLEFRIGSKNLLGSRSHEMNSTTQINSLIMMLQLKELGLACLDLENELFIFNPLKDEVYRRINTQSLVGTMLEPKFQENLNEILSTFEANRTDLLRFENLINRRLNDVTALNMGVLLWIRKDLATIFPETCPTQAEVKNLFLAGPDCAAHGYMVQWNRALDFLQGLEKLNLSKDLDAALVSFNLNKKELVPARKIACLLFHDLLRKSVERMQSLLQDGKSSDTIVKLRDDLCNEICECVLFATDLGVTIDGDVLVTLVEALNKIITSLDYRNPDYGWKGIGSRILATSILSCNTNRSICQISHFISESLRFEECFVEIQNRVRGLEQEFKSLKETVGERTENSLRSFLRMTEMILDLQTTLTDFSYIIRKFNDARKLEDEFENLYADIVSWGATEKRLGTANSLLIFDIVCQAFGLFKSEFITSELDKLLSPEQNDVVLLVIDAMPSYFSRLFQSSRKLDLKAFVGFSVFPSETAPGHTSIFTGMQPAESHIFSNEIVFKNHSESLIDSTKIRELSQSEEHALKGIYNQSLIRRLIGVGINTSIFIPTNYRKSLLTKIILGGSLKNSEIRECKKGIDIFEESQMIPTGKAPRKFYVVLDNEIDVTQHAGLKRYCYEEKEIEKLYRHYSDYFERLNSFLYKITQNATAKGRRMLVIVTADHGVATLKYVDNSFPDLLRECGLGFVSSRGLTVNCPQPTKLHGGIYSKYDLMLFENPQVCEKVGLSRQQAQQSRLAYSSLHVLHSISRAVLIYTENPQRFDSMKVLSIHCRNCGYKDLIAVASCSLCPKCGAGDLRVIELGTLRMRLLETTKKHGFHTVYVPPQTRSDDSSLVWDPHFLIFPNFNSIFSKYPSNPREYIMYLLKLAKKPLSQNELKQKYTRANVNDEPDEESEDDFGKALQDLIDLHYVEERNEGRFAPVTEDYSGSCTVITHGGISPAETLIPFIILRNEVGPNKQ